MPGGLVPKVDIETNSNEERAKEYTRERLLVFDSSFLHEGHIALREEVVTLGFVVVGVVLSTIVGGVVDDDEEEGPEEVSNVNNTGTRDLRLSPANHILGPSRNR